MKKKADLIATAGIIGTIMTIVGGIVAGAAELAEKLDKEEKTESK